MANNSYINSGERQYDRGGEQSFYPFGVGLLHNLFDRLKTMATKKMIYLTLETLGIGFWVGGILANLDNGKSWVLFMLGAMYGVMRLIFTWQQKSQAIREKELELWHKEQDKEDRMNKKKGVA